MPSKTVLVATMLITATIRGSEFSLPPSSKTSFSASCFSSFTPTIFTSTATVTYTTSHQLYDIVLIKWG